jgi:hypothetical protein
MQRELLDKETITFEDRQIATKLKNLLERFIILFVGFLNIDSSKCICTPFDKFFTLFPMFSIMDDLQVEVPDV